MAPQGVFYMAVFMSLGVGGRLDQHCATKGHASYGIRTTHDGLYPMRSLCNGQTSPKGSPYRRDPRFQGVYTFPVRPIPTMHCSDPDALAAIDNGMPVVLLNCTFANSAMKWSIEYLLENLRDEGHPAYVSRNRRFLYYDVSRVKGEYADWQPPQQHRLVLFQDFIEMSREIEKSNNGSRSYFQSPLVIDEGVSASLEGDINSFDYPWLLDMVQRQGWGTDVINLLLVGMPDVVTPAHYDILENFYLQISGLKRVILFNPEHFRSLYPFPVAHPHDRQTQVNFDEPDFVRFPRFKDIEGLEAVLGPGDVLYLPSYWWHYIESENKNMTISMNFWFEPKNKTNNNSYPKEEEQEGSFSLKTQEHTKENGTETSQIPVQNEDKTFDTDSNSAETTGKLDTPEEKLQIPKEKSEITEETAEIPELKGEIPEVKAEIPEVKEEMPKVTEEIPEIKEEIPEVKEEIPEEKAIIFKDKAEYTESGTQEDDSMPKQLSAAQYLALRREIEVSLFKATHDHRKVRQLLDEILHGRFDFLDSQ